MAARAEWDTVREVAAARADDLIGELADCPTATSRAREFAEGLNLGLGLDDGRCWCGHCASFSLGDWRDEGRQDKIKSTITRLHRVVVRVVVVQRDIQPKHTPTER